MWPIIVETLLEDQDRATQHCLFFLPAGAQMHKIKISPEIRFPRTCNVDNWPHALISRLADVPRAGAAALAIAVSVLEAKT